MLAWLFVAWLGPPDAAPSLAEPSERPRVVLMVPTREGERDERVLATLDAHLHDLDIELVDERYASELDLRELVAASHDVIARHDARGVLWIDMVDMSDHAQLAIYVVARDSSQIYGRTLAGDPQGSDALALETLANVAAMAATALGEGRAIQLEAEVEPARPPTPAQPQPPPAPTGEVELAAGQLRIIERPWLRVRAGYRGSSYAATLPWQSAFVLGLGVRPSPRSHVELVGEAVVPSTIDDGELRARIHTIPFGLGGGQRWSLRRGWSLELAGRVSLEPTRRAVWLRDASPRRTSTRLWWSATSQLELVAGVELTSSVRLTFGLALVLVLARRDLVADLDGDASGDSGNPRTLVSPAPLRALVSAGFEFDLAWR